MPARKAAEVATEIAARGQRLKGVRIDSGDLAGLAIKVRKILNEAGFPDIKIIGSGGLDEYNLTKLSGAQIPFDSYGVGTRWAPQAMRPGQIWPTNLLNIGTSRVLKTSPGRFPGRELNNFFGKETIKDN